METVTKEDLFDDYKLICKMKVGIARKARMLSELFAESPNPWCVTGVTIDALNVFKNADFQKKSKMGVNRSHLVDRNSVYKLMFTNEFDDSDLWWDYYIKNDKTILSTSSENMSKSFSRVIAIDETLGLFKNSGFAWKHGKNEKAFLQKLYKDIIDANI